MNDNKNLLTGILLGAAAGAAIGYLLTTENGKNILKEAKDLISKAGETIKDVAGKYENQAEEVIDKGKKMMNGVAERTNYNN
jgi:gas vesicle protein